MASLGKKILSAFVEVNSDKPKPSEKNDPSGEKTDNGAYAQPLSTPKQTSPQTSTQTQDAPRTDARFAAYFDRLFREANIPGPDYYEFAAMIQALHSVPDEAARFSAAFAGLQVQGLDKEKLLSTAAEYLRILDSDAAQFNSTVDATLQEKVHARKTEAAQKQDRMVALKKEIESLDQEVHALETAIREDEEKINARNTSYLSESAERKNRIQADIEKIKNHIH